MKYMYIAAAVIISIAALVGFVLPLLFSAKADIAVLLGLVIIFVVVMSAIHFLFNFVKKGSKNEQK